MKFTGYWRPGTEGIPVFYRLQQQITPKSPNIKSETANNTPQPQCGHMLLVAGVGANCRSKAASVEWNILASSWEVVGTANKVYEFIRKEYIELTYISYEKYKK